MSSVKYWNVAARNRLQHPLILQSTAERWNCGSLPQ